MQWQVLFNVSGWCNVSPAWAARAVITGSRVRLVSRWQALLARWAGREMPAP